MLVGATAVSMGDQYTTLQSGSAGLISGIEIHANILDSLLCGQQIEELISPWLVVVNWVVPLLTLMLAFFGCRSVIMRRL
nr:CHASE2 domain-containing protein [Formosimonas limnophila]